MGGFTIKQPLPGRLDAELEVKPEPNWIVVVVLLFLWIIPGVIYWYMKTRPVKHSVTLHFVPDAVGTRIAVQAPDAVLEPVAPVLALLPW